MTEPLRIHTLINPHDPELAAARATIWAAIASSPSMAVAFKYKRRWYRCQARVNYGVVITYQSNGKVVPCDREAEILRFLVSEAT